MVKTYTAVSRSDSFDFQEWELTEEGFENFTATEKAIKEEWSIYPGDVKHLKDSIADPQFFLLYDQNGPLIALVGKGTINDYRKYWGPIAYPDK